jgi:hypothetical protein
MQKALSLFSTLDWVVAGGTIVAGVLLGQAWLVGLGLFGLLVAWYSPAKRVQGRLRRYLVKKHTPLDQSQVVAREDEFYASLQASPTPDAQSGSAVGAPLAPSFAPRTLTYAPLRLNPSRHNLLKPAAFDLAPRSKNPAPWA